MSVGHSLGDKLTLISGETITGRHNMTMTMK